MDVLPIQPAVDRFSGARIAVLVPCYNEEQTIAAVISDFRRTLPEAIVYVFDNNSADGTIVAARAAGAVVRQEPLQGKGNVVRRMFADVEADVYVLVDGDDTYDAGASPSMVKILLDNGLDMVAGARKSDEKAAYRSGHRFGNELLTSIVQRIFGGRLTDMLTGYRIFSRRFVKSFPALSSGFEIETELTIHALEMRMNVLEVPTVYKSRPMGSSSKLRTYRDGFRILRTIVLLLKEERPLSFFAGVAAVLASASLGLAWPIVVEFVQTGLVPRFPTAILATGLMLTAFLSLASGFILDTVTRGRREMKRLHYLSIPAALSSAGQMVQRSHA